MGKRRSIYGSKEIRTFIASAAIIFGLSILLSQCSDSTGTEIRKVKNARGFTDIYEGGTSDQCVDAQPQAAEVLATYCAGCHNVEQKAGGLGDISDIDEVIASDHLVPGDAEKSPIFARVFQDLMPPSGKPKPSQAEIEALRDWIDNMGDADSSNLAFADCGTASSSSSSSSGGSSSSSGGKNGGSGAAPLQLVTPDEEFLAALNDLDNIARISPNDARFKRYFSFANLENAGLEGSLRENFVNSLSRFVNSLSDNRRIVQPRKITSNSTIYRVDIRDYGWSLNDWEALIAVYPYEDLQQSSAREQSFIALSDTAMPIVRADWFVFQASQPEFYHRFLDVPAQVRQLEANLGVNVVQNLLQQIDGSGGEGSTVLRAGFLNSGVALNNRVLERHDSLFGAFWVSYDFQEPDFNDQNDVDDKDIFRSPLGPLVQVGGNLAFDHDGGEIIFNLPNGLNGYMLVDGIGQRIDIAPQDVVSDPDRPEGIINGYSCMTCHAGGLIDKADEVRAAIQGNGGFNINDRLLIEQLYAESDDFAAAIEQDNDIYKLALKRASITLDGQNHIVVMATQYEKDVSVEMVAAEFGLSADEFLIRLAGSDDDLRRKMSSLSSSSTINRRVFESLIGQIMFEFFPSPRSR